MTDQQVDPRELRCPVAHGQAFNPYSLEASQDPEPWLALAREDVPVFWDEKIGAFVFTRYDDIVSILTNPKVFSSKHMLKHRPIPEELTEYFPDGHPGLHSLTFMDNPKHGRIRRLANQAFTPRRIAAMEPAVTEIVHQLIDHFVDDGETDLFAVFTSQLPMLLMRQIAGATDESDLDFTSWGPDYFALTESAPPLTPERIQQIGAKSGRILKWMRDYVELRRDNPGHDDSSPVSSKRAHLKATLPSTQPRSSGC
jgi:cytochrome P450